MYNNCCVIYNSICVFVYCMYFSTKRCSTVLITMFKDNLGEGLIFF